ncbi:dihydropteroate synthase [Microlunatus speluncae]|uniref:dihydropteroate synthase n=1 Tax=Microlunatus speluncae TaxID=2594267 RepID=UPI0012663B95|nr:dihydropteroate synthase [Microlunatus speluncae]
MKRIPVVTGLPAPGRTTVMGVVNVTPDSFSDGGEWLDPDDAIRHGHELIAEGADLIDVGGESTRPGAVRPSIEEELRRVLPVIRELTAAGAVVSVDTMRAVVAEAAVAAGARMINDVSGGRADPAMLRTVAGLGVAYICMHWRGHSEDMYSRAVYRDVVAEVIIELREQLDQAVAAGIEPGRLIIDPGFGFAKTAEHNWELLRRFDEFDVLGLPLLLGVSRKRFLSRLLADGDRLRPARQCDDASMALTVIAARQQRLWGVRVHAVRPHRDAIEVIERLHRIDSAEQPATSQ